MARVAALLLKEGGYNAQQLKDGGYGVMEIKATGLPASAIESARRSEPCASTSFGHAYAAKSEKARLVSTSP